MTCSDSASAEKTDFISKAVSIAGRELRYAIYVPADYDPNKPQPTILFLNGHGECGTDGLKQTTAGLGTAVSLDADAWPFLIIFPQKQEYEANWEEEEEMVMAILDQTRNEYNVDPSRLYLTGISQGGHGTWAIASEHPELFAAIAPVCGWGDQQMAERLVGMPIWTFHGDADSAVPVKYTVAMADFLKAAGGDCKLTIYPGVEHNSWDKAYQEEKLGEWFLQHSK